ILLAQGLSLANYQFLVYRGNAPKLRHSLNIISFGKHSATMKEVTDLAIMIDAVYEARTLVNEPLSFLGAVQLSTEIAALGKKSGFKVTVLDKAGIKEEKMGGILAVTRGS